MRSRTTEAAHCWAASLLLLRVAGELELVRVVVRWTAIGMAVNRATPPSIFVLMVPALMQECELGDDVATPLHSPHWAFQNFVDSGTDWLACLFDVFAVGLGVSQS